jgi:hypothetical protein
LSGKDEGIIIQLDAWNQMIYKRKAINVIVENNWIRKCSFMEEVVIAEIIKVKMSPEKMLL